MISESDRRRLQALGYLEARVLTQPSSQFHYPLASLYSEHRLIEDANRSYKHAIRNDPSNVMVRNDYGIHLASVHRKEDALDELQKGKT